MGWGGVGGQGMGEIGKVSFHFLQGTLPSQSTPQHILGHVDWGPLSWGLGALLYTTLRSSQSSVTVLVSALPPYTYANPPSTFPFLLQLTLGKWLPRLVILSATLRVCTLISLG